MQIPKIIELPDYIQNSFQYMAHYLIGEMKQSKLEVILVPAPDQRHYGHKVRLAVNHNPRWWSEMYANHPTKLDRQRFMNALHRIFEACDNDTKYDCLAREKIKDFLTEGLYGELIDFHVLEYFEQLEEKVF